MSVSKINYNDKNEAYIIVDPISEIDKNDFKNYLDMDSPLFLSCEFENDKVFTLFYSYENYIPLKTFLSQVVSKDKALSLLKSLTKAFIEAADNDLNVDHILLGVNSIFCNPDTHQAACVYVPVTDGILPARPLRLFLKELLVNMIYSEEEDMTWLGNLIRYISNHRQIEYSDFYTFLDTLDSVTGAESKNETAFVTPVVPKPHKLSDTDELKNLQDVLNASDKEADRTKKDEPSYYLYRRSDRSMFVLGQKDMRIGKAMDNEICIKDNPVISRVHAIIRYNNGSYTIQDHESTNHTFVNGIVLEPNTIKKLSLNDRILLGNEEFILKIQ